MKKSNFTFASLLCGVAIVVTFLTISCSHEEIQSPIAANSGSKSANATSTSEVTLSGNTWTAKVDGATKYTGTDLFAACNAAINAMTDGGTLNLRASGSSGASGGGIKSINLRNDVTFNGNGFTITANTSDHLIVPILGDRKSNIGIKNLKIAGAPRYAVWLKGCKNITISGLTMNMNNGWLGLRIDNSTGETSNANVGNIVVSGCSEGVETYGLDGFTCGTVTASNGTECGLLFNASKNCTVGAVTATNMAYGAGYAGFRVANSNGPNVKVTGTVKSTKCGRGFFSVTGSNGTYVNRLEATGCSSHGILLQNASYTTVNGGFIKDCGGDAGVRFSENSHHNLINGLDITGVAKGVNETSPSDYNTVQNCNVHGLGITLRGSHSVSKNNKL